MLKITAENIALNQSFSTAEEAIAFSGAQLIRLGYVTEDYTAIMQVRQKKVSVYIGNFVALPHGEVEEGVILEEGIFITQVPDGVNFGTADNRQIATIVIAVALTTLTQLTVLQELALFFSDIKNVQQLSDETDEAAFLALLTTSLFQ